VEGKLEEQVNRLEEEKQFFAGATAAANHVRAHMTAYLEQIDRKRKEIEASM
jgi:hypothetical protein